MQNSGQMTFFQTDYNNQIINETQMQARIIEHFSQYGSWVSLTEAQADFFVKYGAICKSGIIQLLHGDIPNISNSTMKRLKK